MTLPLESVIGPADGDAKRREAASGRGVGADHVVVREDQVRFVVAADQLTE